MIRSFIVGLIIGFLSYKLVRRVSDKRLLYWGFKEIIWAISLIFILVSIYTWFVCMSCGVGG